MIFTGFNKKNIKKLHKQATTKKNLVLTYIYPFGPMLTHSEQLHFFKYYKQKKNFFKMNVQNVVSNSKRTLQNNFFCFFLSWV